MKMKRLLFVILLTFPMIMAFLAGCYGGDDTDTYHMVHLYMCNDLGNRSINMTLTIDGEIDISNEVPPQTMGVTGHRTQDEKLSDGPHEIEVHVMETHQNCRKTVNVHDELWILITPYEEIDFNIMDKEPAFM